MSELPRLAFVIGASEDGDEDDVLRLVAHEVALLGARPTVVHDAPADTIDDTVYVFSPRLRRSDAASLHPARRQLSRSIAVCSAPVDRDHSGSTRLAAAAGHSFHLQPDDVDRLRAIGVEAEHFRVGYSAYWDHWQRDESETREVDVLHLDVETPRRLAVVATCGPRLWRHRSRLFLPPDDANAPREDRPAAPERRELLRRAKVVLHLRADDQSALAWTRILEAICNGSVVVTEPTTEPRPLVVGSHLLGADAQEIGSLVVDAIRDPERLQAVRLAAYDFVSHELPVRPSAERLLAVAAMLARRPPRRGRSPSPERAGARRTTISLARRAHGRFSGRPREARRRALEKARFLSEIEERRRLRRLELEAGAVDPTVVDELLRTPAYTAACPRVSVIVPLYNHRDEVEATLASVAASEHPSFELIVLDDASTDDSRAVVSSVLGNAPMLPAVLLAHRVNRGVGRSRSELARRARGTLVFALDSDNEIYPTALTRLEEALDADQGAAFAYSTLEVHTGGVPISVSSHQPWEPRRLRLGNYIDAMAMIRRDTLLGLGGYTEDTRLHGWEDYDLWCRMAEHGLRGTHVPEILCRYRRAEGSMLSVTNLDLSMAMSVLRERYPNLMASP